MNPEILSDLRVESSVGGAIALISKMILSEACKNDIGLVCDIEVICAEYRKR